MAETSAFATPFAADQELYSSEGSSSSSPRLSVGFTLPSAAPICGLQRAATTGLLPMERRGSLGAALREAAAPKPPPALRLNVARGRGPGTRVVRVPRFESIAEKNGAQQQQQREQWQPGTAKAAETLRFAAPAACGAGGLLRAPSSGLQRAGSATVAIPR